jgi:hypothetical protein
MIRYSFNEELGIVESILLDEINLSEIAEHINNIGKDPSLPTNLKILTDARKAVLNFDPKSISILIETIQNAKIKHESIKEAILHDDPDVAGYSFLYQKMLTPLVKHTFKIYSTEEAALKWLTEEV